VVEAVAPVGGVNDEEIRQAAELIAEAMLLELDGVDDDDTVRPRMIWEALHEDFGRAASIPPEITAGQLRARLHEARGRLARGEVP
jgi:hypothetical protein